MPELPEVETIRRALIKQLTGRRIENINVRDDRLRWPVNALKLQVMLGNATFNKFDRRSKYLLLGTDRNTILLIHLGMSGRLLFINDQRPFEKHDHVIFDLDNGSQLRFRDPRRFGMVDSFPAEEEASHPRLQRLGYEPFSDNLTAKTLFERANSRKGPIKNFLMDASIIVGIGNIYANEALFHARIHPTSAAGKLSRKQWESLLTCIREVLQDAIKQGGSTLKDFVNSNGETGYFQNAHFVYGREEQPCLKCGQPIQRIIQAGRSSFYCPKCQQFA